jgi:hypothetical protein
LQSLHAITRDRDFMPVLRQHLDQRCAKFEIIFDEKNMWHGGSWAMD